MKLHQAMEAAPPTPKCFHDRRAWAEYLCQCQTFGKRAASRPFDSKGVYRPEFNFCGDCLPAHAAAMNVAGKCAPNAFRGIPVVVRAAARAE